jgi:hypothetical protein
VGGFFFAAVPAVLAGSGLLLRLVSGAPMLARVEPAQPPPPAEEVAAAATPELVPVPPPVTKRISVAEVIEEYSQGRLSNAKTLARSAEHSKLLAKLDRFEHHYAAGVEARTNGKHQEALRHLQECLRLDREMTKGQSDWTLRLQRQVASLKSKR